MKQLKIFYLLTVGALIYGACTENSDYPYNAPQDSVYFDLESVGGRIVFSFADTTMDVEETTLRLPVKIAGKRVPYDRHFSVEVVDSQTTAQPGLHYAPLAESYTLPADSGTFLLPVVLYNKDEILLDSTLNLSLRLRSSDDFSIGFPHLISARISFSGRLEEPEWWHYWVGELGYYSRTKHYLFLISSGTKVLSSPSEFLLIPKVLYHISEYKAFLSDPFAWQEKHPEYALDEQGKDYLFYLKTMPEKTFLLKWEESVGKYYFIDENGEYVLY